MSDFTQTQLDAVNAAIANGKLTVEYDGKRITYRSMAELMQARELIRADLAAASNASTSRSVLAEFGRT